MIQSEIGSLTFKLYLDYSITVSFKYTECAANGSLNEQQKEMTVKYEYFDHTSTLVSLTRTKSSDSSSLVYAIPRYQLNANTSYLLNISAELSTNSLVRTSLSIPIFVESSELLVYIEGGNRQNGYESELVVRGVAKDLDVVESDQELGITRTWVCEDIINSN